MRQLVIGDTYGRDTAVITGDETIRQLLTEHNIGFTGTVTVDGQIITNTEFDQPIRDFSSNDKIFLMSIVKSDNAR